ncbi:MAG: hypothetical protein MI725_13960, partial [Pirellulales bacterium]|nr:hypothetical protein [Pirellulales bacterium]
MLLFPGVALRLPLIGYDEHDLRPITVPLHLKFGITAIKKSVFHPCSICGYINLVITRVLVG